MGILRGRSPLEAPLSEPLSPLSGTPAGGGGPSGAAPAGSAPRLGDRSGFSRIEARAYVNHAAVSPLSDSVIAAVLGQLHAVAALGVGAVPQGVAQRDGLRARLGRLLGAAADRVALSSGTTRGVQDVAFGLDWREGDRVLLFEGEFPANVTPWQQAARAFALRPERLPLDGFGDGSGLGLARVEDALKQGGVRIVAVSAVQFQTGLRMPLAELVSLCEAHGAELFVDGIQAAGVVPLDLGALGVHHFVGGGHKWLMGPEGTGLLITAERARPYVPRLGGWLSHVDGLRFLFEGEGHLRADRPLIDGPRFIEGGAAPAAGLAGLDAAVSDLLALGVPAIYAHVQAFHDRIEPRLIGLGLRSHRAKEPGARSGSLCFRLPPEVHGPTLVRLLGEAGVSVTLPDGQLRISPHWPTPLAQADAVAEAVEGCLPGARAR